MAEMKVNKRASSLQILKVPSSDKAAAETFSPPTISQLPCVLESGLLEATVFQKETGAVNHSI